MSLEVLGLGAVAMDVVLNCETLPGEDGYAVVDRETVTPGGSCANLLVVLAGLGVKTGLAAQLGDDGIGQKLKRDLEENGVSTRHVLIKKGGVSMHTYVAVDRRGAKSIFCNMGESLLALDENDVHAQMLEGVKIFYTDLQPGPPALKLARICKQKQIPVVYNLQVEPAFLNRCGISGQDVEEMLSLSLIIVTFKQGLIHYTGRRDIMEAAKEVYEAHNPPSGIIVTLGRDGVMWYDEKCSHTAPAFRVKAVDTTGAGDAFLGGFIRARFFENYDRQKALTFANACAALKCLRPGPRLQVSKSEVLSFMKEQGAIKGDNGQTVFIPSGLYRPDIT